MRIRTEYKKAGYFWLPHDPMNKIPGILCIEDGGGINLDLFGYFDTCDSSFYKPKEFNLYGEIEGDRIVTLNTCFYTFQDIFSDVIKKSSIYAKNVFEGIHCEENKFNINNINFKVENIDAWINQTRLKINYEDDTFKIKFIYSDKIIYELNNGVLLSLIFEYYSDRTKNLSSIHINQNVSLQLETEEKKTLEEYTTYIHRITNFICLTTNSIVTISDVKTSISLDESNNKQEILIYYQSIPFKENQEIYNDFKAIVHFDNIKDKLGTCINNWINAYNELEPAFNLFFSTKIGAQRYLDGKFLALAQGLESLHRRMSAEKRMNDGEYKELTNSILSQCPQENKEWLRERLANGNELSLRNRLQRLIEPLENYFSDHIDISNLISEIINTRNYFTHYDKKLQKKISRGSNLFFLCNKMEAIYIFHFFIILGFNNEEINKIIKQSHSLQNKIYI